MRRRRLVALTFLVVALSCDDEGDGGGEAESACDTNADCDGGFCLATGRCKLLCEQPGTLCADGSTCFAAEATDGAPVNVCSARGCTPRDCSANSVCDLTKLLCVCREGFEAVEGRCTVCHEENRIEDCEWPDPEAVCACIDLRGQDLSGADLSGEDLAGARYDNSTTFPENVDPSMLGALGPGAELPGAELHGLVAPGVNLAGANLMEADLSNSDLSEANLSGANLAGANLQDANLQGANLKDANLQGADLRGADLSGANLDGANLAGANIEGADLTGVEGDVPAWVEESIGADGKASAEKLARAIKEDGFGEEEGELAGATRI